LHENDFRLVTQRILSKYDGTPLLSRWQEAISFGAGVEATDYWIRDSEHVVNIVWLNPDGIRDITMVQYVVSTEDEDEDPLNGDVEDEEEEEKDEGKETVEPETDDYSDELGYETMFNFIPLRNISSFEMREGESIAFRMGLGVSGNKLVHVIPSVGVGSVGHLLWF
jgi:hypothetical protein